MIGSITTRAAPTCFTARSKRGMSSGIAKGSINITKNRVEVYVTDRERFEALLRRASVEHPEHVAVVKVDIS